MAHIENRKLSSAKFVVTGGTYWKPRVINYQICHNRRVAHVENRRDANFLVNWWHTLKTKSWRDTDFVVTGGTMKTECFRIAAPLWGKPPVDPP